MPIIKTADSGSIERLATVCKIIQDTKSIDSDRIILEMKKWKKDKFTEADTVKSFKFVVSQGWDKILLK
jgi:hypothetical protein